MEIIVCGVRLTLPYKNWRIYLQSKMKRLHEKRAYSKMRSFFKKRERYEARHKRNMVRRLFITSGNFHLVNMLALISQKYEQETMKVENIVLVWSSVSNNDFEQVNRNIASMHGIKYYYAFCGPDWSEDRIVDFLVTVGLYRIDEVYSLSNAEHHALYNRLYRGVKHILTDEGVYTVLPPSGAAAENCSEMVTTFYLKKLNHISAQGRCWKHSYIGENHFRMIADRCASAYPWNPIGGDKCVIFCATYSASWAPYTAQRLSERQNEIIDKLQERGYEVLYKPHPRDPELPTESKSLKIIHSKLPLECYHVENILAVVSLYSSASTQAYHYLGVPGFIDPIFCAEVLPDHLQVLALSYTLSVEDILSVDAHNLSHQDLKAYLRGLMKAKLEQAPLLSDNVAFNSLYNQHQ